MSGTGLEQVKPEERWQRSSDPARGILAATQRGRDRGGGGKGATWGGGSSAETVQVIGCRGQDLSRVQNVMDPGAGRFKGDAGSGETQRGLCGPLREGRRPVAAIGDCYGGARGSDSCVAQSVCGGRSGK